MRVLTTGTLILVAALCAPQVALGEGGSVFGEMSRTAAFAGAVTGRPGDNSSMTFNPGALADVDEPTFTLSGQFGRLDMWFERPDEERESMDRTIAGFGFAISAPLPGPPWLRAFRVGTSVYVPAGHALEISAPERDDIPYAPIYGSRAQHVSAVTCIAVDLFSYVSLGASLAVTPELVAPTRVTYVPGRGDTPDENVVVDIERELKVKMTWIAGLRVQPWPFLSLGAVYRQAQIVRATGANDVRAGTVEVTDALDFYDFWSPDEVALGVAGLGDNWSISADVIWSAWSEFRTIHNRAAEPSFEDTWTGRLGGEWLPNDWLAVRLGYAYEPSPVPSQQAATNFVDSDRHVLALGGGLDFRDLVGFSMNLDLHFRTHILGTQHAEKIESQLNDADEDAAGLQIDNLGFPEYSASGSFWQGGLTLTFYLGGEEGE